MLELSIILPAYNEEQRIVPTIHSLYSFLRQLDQNFEILVIDDGSTDTTVKTVKELQKEFPELQVKTLGENKGKGAAVKTGMLAASGRKRVYLDADGATPPEELAKLIAALDKGADIAIGSRALYSRETNIKTHLHRKLIGRVFNTIVNLLAVPGIADTQCGCKMFTAETAETLFPLQKSSGFSFDVEILMLAQKAKYKIDEIPINWTNVEGSKVNLVNDSFRMLLDVLRFPILHGSTSIEPVANVSKRNNL